jgi:hypothetical protein
LWETRFGLFSRFLDPEPGDVEGRRKRRVSRVATKRPPMTGN